MAELTALAETAFRVAAALLFLLAGWIKFRAGHEFRATLGNYQLLPEPLVTLAATVLPPLELALGLALILGMDRPEPAYAAAGLLVVFAIAMAINLWRGRAFIECGCHLGAAPHARLGWSHVVRNVSMAAALGILAGAVDRLEPAALAIGGIAGIVLFALDHVYAALGELRNSVAVGS